MGRSDCSEEGADKRRPYPGVMGIDRPSPLESPFRWVGAVLVPAFRDGQARLSQSTSGCPLA